jgi:hypothetical protein
VQNPADLLMAALLSHNFLVPVFLDLTLASCA